MNLLLMQQKLWLIADCSFIFFLHFLKNICYDFMNHYIIIIDKSHYKFPPNNVFAQTFLTRFVTEAE